MIKVLFIILILIRASGEETEPQISFGDKPISRVINGWNGKLGDVPYQVAFKLQVKFTEYNTFCGGSIVADNKVLSAAHCFVEDPTNCERLFHLKATLRPLRRMYAVAGTIKNLDMVPSDSDSNGQWRKLKAVKYPRSFNFPSFDLCVVVTTRPFVFNQYVNYIPYASKLKDYTGTCLTSGFGSISAQYILLPPQLLLAHLTMVPIKECKETLSLAVSTRNFVCTAPPAGTARGDSGGPLVCQKTNDPKENSSRGILVGITCGTYTIPPYYSLFTRVSLHKDFIDTHVNTGCRLKSYVLYLIIYIIFLF